MEVNRIMMMMMMMEGQWGDIRMQKIEKSGMRNYNIQVG